MKPIQDIVNRILHDASLQKEEYVLFYYDRIEKVLKEIPATSIKKLEGTFLILHLEGEEVEIPLHRIREVRKEGKLIWKR
ncbi:DUF504 domain-containing protein [Candidatus Woesearchaeota archaeon]|nr:DUF504 domain-containing protein [Candidatus Woesearchaeota archaeon]